MPDLPSLPESLRAELPQPVLPGRPELVQAWEATWAMAAQAVTQDDSGKARLQSGLSPVLYQWDAAFAPFWLRYGSAALGVEDPASLLDPFYRHQRADGELPLAIGEAGEPLFADSETGWEEADESGWTHPARVLPPAPLAWAEWEYANFSGDESRLPRVLPILARDFDWQAAHRARPSGCFFWTPPVGAIHPLHDMAWGWADYTSLAALTCEHMAAIALLCGDHGIAKTAAANYLGLKEYLNEQLWDELNATFVDIDEDELPLGGLHAGTFWGLLAGLPSQERGAEVCRLAQTYRHFARPHPVPSLAASEKWYARRGARWRGAVWPPHSYAAAVALTKWKQHRVAAEIALRHAEAVAGALVQSGAFWDGYAPDFPGSPAEDAKPGFTGWSGLSTVALLVEQILGLRVEGAPETLRWRPAVEEDHGIENLTVGSVQASLLARRLKGEWEVTIETTGPLEALLEGAEGTTRVEFEKAGRRTVVV